MSVKNKNIESVYPLSPLQQGMLFHTLYAPNSGVYVEQFDCALSGRLDLTAFQTAWQRLIDRHSILRTAFAWERLEEPVQVAGRNVKAVIETLDWSELTDAEFQSRLDVLLDQERSRGFKLSKAPLMRFMLIKRAPEAHQFLWTYHHLLLDGWSLSILLGELFTIYESLRRNARLQMAPVRPYKDYIAWLREQDREKAEAFWRGNLAGLTAPTVIPISRALGDRGEDLTPAAYGRLEVALSETTSSALKTFARNSQITLNTIVQGAWALLLSRYCGQQDVIFGATVSGRPPEMAGVDSMVGLFINTLPVRVTVRGDRRMTDWLKELQERQAEARQYEYSSLIEIQGWSDTPRDQKLFECILVFENYPLGEAIQTERTGLEVADVRAFEQTNYPLTVAAVPGAQIKLLVGYDGNRFDADVIERLLHHWMFLLEQMSGDASARLSEYQLLTAAERERALAEIDAPPTERPDDTCIHRLFEKQVERTPLADAIVCEDETISYDDLNRRANRLAGYLRFLGVGPEHRVGLCLERGPEMLVSMLAVLKAGAAYAPMDPAYPEERLAFMLGDGRVQWLISRRALIEKIPVALNRLVDLDESRQAIEQFADGDPADQVDADNLAYVIYTSGSTGKPRGVMVSQQGLANYSLAMAEKMTIAPGDRILQFASISFDASVVQIFPALISGAAVVIHPAPSKLSNRDLLRLCEEKGVTILDLPTAFWHQWIDEMAAARVALNPQLRVFMTGGEDPSTEKLKLLLGLTRRPVLFISSYGPTEATVGAAVYQNKDGLERFIDSAKLPIGKLLANTRIYLLDKEQHLTPVGVPGEIFIGGAGVSRGYLYLPDLTAEKFVPDPFSTIPGARLYRTGDQARRLADGNIEFLGRIDHQVKIRGFRIELHEIEEVLSNHPAVLQAVVAVHEEAGGIRRLVAYLTLEEGTSSESSELREFLRTRLPEYMIPSFFVTLERMPLTPNGKIDRKGLPAPERGGSERSYVEPRTGTEQRLARIWSQVLGLERAGAEDNFFESGGHSLLATQLISRVREEFGQEIALKQLFESPTVEGLGRIIDGKQASGEQASGRKLLRADRSAALPLSFAQQRLWFIDQMDPGNAVYNIAAAVRLEGALDVDALERSLNRMVERHESLRTRFPNEGGKPRQEIVEKAPAELRLLNVSGPEEASQAEIGRLSEEEANRGFDLSEGPLVRWSLARRTAEDHTLIVVMHHIISDGWSMGVLIRELSALYEQERTGKTEGLPALPPIEVQYADYAWTEAQWRESGGMAEELEYWKKQLEGLSGALELPFDRPRPAMQSHRGARRSMRIDRETSEALKALTLRRESTLYMGLLAGLDALLWKYSGQEDIAVGSPIAGRTQVELEGLIGFFVNTLVMRVNVGGDPSFEELLGRARESALGGYGHQGAPFEQVVEELRPERATSHSPLFQVMLILQNTPMETIELPGLKLSGAEAVKRTSMFDLTLSLAEGAEGLEGWVEYNEDLFDPETIDRMLSHYNRLLSDATRNPEKKISKLSLMSEIERDQVIGEWNRTKEPYASERTIQSLITERAAQKPEATAVVCGERGLSYRELEEESNRLARYLIGAGARPEQLVGVCVERSERMVAALLGILKAGGAYVPMDPSYPSDRLSYMAEDSGMKVLVSESGVIERLPESIRQSGVRIVSLDGERESIERESAEALEERTTGENLAYVIYTSGSTGRPKGVEISQRALVNFLETMSRKPGLNRDDRLLSVTSLSFDIAGLEIYLPLLAGARVEIATAAEASDGRKLMRRLSESRATVMQGTPSTWRLLTESGWRGDPKLKVLVGGEAIGEKQAWELSELSREAWNMYGPTETTIWSSVQPLRSGEKVSLGAPVGNTQMYVLDERQEAVGIGVVGELYIGGDGLARGYLQRPELTAERFLPDPYSGEAGSRLYRTGDLVRRRRDGGIEYLGRTDHQVKLRGYRIELKEIEQRLMEHEGVKQAVAVVRGETDADKRLVAYIVPDLEAQPDGRERAEHVGSWGNVWEDTYRNDQHPQDASLSFAGWNSRYTGKPIPADEMREWADAAAERILSLNPRQVLEIGSGMGLLLFRIAAHCERYHGIDLSASALDYSWREANRIGLNNISLWQGAAESFRNLTSHSYDTIILNSVVQYFPDIDYLVDVVRNAVESTRPGGRIFIGDVRSFHLLEAFHASMAFHKAADALTRAELSERIRNSIAEEEELTIHPDFFHALKQRLPAIDRVRIELKAGQAQNEMTLFRYDVVLEIGPSIASDVQTEWVDWESVGASPSGLSQWLADRSPQSFGVRQITNARLSNEMAVLDWLAGEEAQTISDLRAQLSQQPRTGVFPEQLTAVAASQSYHVELRWSAGAAWRCFDAVFSRGSAPTDQVIQTSFDSTSFDWRRYANDPLKINRKQNLVRGLRDRLRESLPEYMIPSFFVTLERMPLTPNGKIDRKGLPAPERGGSERSYVEPRTGTEQRLARIWSQVLGLERAGAEDNFFESGGHSLLATQLISRVREEFGQEIALKQLFESPTVEGLGRIIDGKQASGEQASGRKLLRADRSAALPLSFAQQRLWFIDQMDPGNAVYNIAAAVRLEGALDVDALERSLNRMVERHESLRTRFPNEGGKPRQEIVEKAPAELRLLNVSGPEEASQAEIGRLSEEEANRGFDLSEGPLVRWSLARRTAEDHTLIVVMHHIISDGWSMGVLIRELSALYEQERTGKTEGLPALPPIEVQYADYAWTEAQWRESGGMAEELEYWKKQLEGLSGALELPFDRPRPAMQSHRGARRSMRIDRETSEALKALTLRRESTLYMGLLAGLDALLWKYSGQEDIAVGSPIAGRTQVELEGLIGFFVNTLVMRVNVGGDPSFEELLGRARESALGGYGHQGAPFEQVVEELRPERATSHSPLFQVMLILQNTPMETIELPGLKLSGAEAVKRTSMFDLTLSLAEGAEGLEGWAEYNEDLFDPETIDRLLSHYNRLLSEATRNPEKKISKLSLMSEIERDQVIGEWNRTKEPYASERTIQSLITERAGQKPETKAVVCGERGLSYRELEEESNRLARYLIGAGARPEQLVGVCVERSERMVAALLGILKAGGAYVPMDPSYPSDRLSYMAEDSGMKVLVSESGVIERLPESIRQSGVRIVSLDGERESIERESAEALEERTSGENLAYVIYTSGSTGRPKGVEISQRALVNFLETMSRKPGLNRDDRLLSVTSLSFDIAGLEIYLPLLAGARVEIATAAEASDGRKLMRRLSESRATVMQGTPSTWRLLTESGWRGDPKLKVLVGGEAIGEKQAWELSELSREAWNMYGPTETTIWSSVQPLRSGEKVSLGAPVGNTQMYVLDERQEAVGIGVVGELYIGGDGLARGYLRRPELTAERFLPDPYGETEGSRLYRTGDLVRRRRDGGIEYLGRTDHQVKLRGYRIELKEIEQRLMEHEGVKQAVAVVRGETDADKRLVAYLILGESGALEPSELREFLRTRLPEYMIPSFFVTLERMPLTPNGKIDRKGLPAPERGGSERSYVEPRTGTEQRLARIWSQVLRLERAGAEDNFFESGGHSLLATQLISRVREEFGQEIALKQLFESPTVEGLGRIIDGKQASGEQASERKLLRADRSVALPLSFAQQRLWFIDQMDPGNAVYNIAAAVRLEGALDAQALERSLNRMVERHESLRTRFPNEGGKPRQEIVEKAPAELRRLDVSGPEEASQAEIGRLSEEEANRGFDLSEGPLVRWSLARRTAEDHTLIVVMHHIISDAWSMGVLIWELAAFYEQERTQGGPVLPPIEIQYADYAWTETQWRESGGMAEELEYWKKQLEGLSGALELPFDRPRPAMQSHRGARRSMRIDRETSEALKALTLRRESTLYMGLLAGLDALLWKYSGQEDIAVGSPIAGRTQVELEGLIGLFVNTLVMRVNVGGDPSFEELLGRARESALGGYGNQGAPFEQVVEELRPERATSHSPLFQVMLILQNTPMGAIELPGLKLSGAEAVKRTSMFDLTLSLAEGADGIEGWAEYNEDLFDPETIDRMLSHYERLLSDATRNPEKKISKLSLMSESERDQVIEEWNRTKEPYVSERTIQSLISEQAGRKDESTAVICGERRMSYRELEEESNRLARYLIGAGVRPEQLVGVCVERSERMVSALLGILKAGGAYVPMDPSYPSDRLSYMAEDSGMKVLVSESGVIERLPESIRQSGVRIVSLDGERESIERESAEGLEERTSGENLAYVIYTSGSTGRPKGVAIEHHNAVALIEWSKGVFADELLEGVLASTSICFDLSIFELFVTLSRGGRVILAENALGLETAPAREEVRLINTVPSAIAELARLKAIPSGVRAINLAGEALAGSLVEEVYRNSQALEVWNLYGPSEDTTYSTYGLAERGSDREPTIGRPVSNTQAYILDESGQPVPVRVTGELYLAGEGLARCYLNRPDLTAERFVPNPFGEKAGDRLYRTGDLCRYLADGRIEFLGRKDHQIKLRGYRIELAEIESSLREQPEIEQAVATATPNRLGEKQLAAYVVYREGASRVGARELKNRLRTRLPEYMVPSMIMELDRMPLNANGKIDRSKLPAIETSDDEAVGVESAMSPIEEMLAGIWSSILGREKVGREENFFEAGGHSLLATQIIARVREVFGVEIAIKSMFESPTISALAAAIDASIKDGAQLGAAAISPAPRDESLPLSFAQQQLWIVDQIDPGNPSYNLPRAMKFTGAFDVEAFTRAIAEIVRRHESLRTTFESVDGLPVQRPKPEITLPLTVIDLRGTPEPALSIESEKLIAEESARPFDLARGPLMRALVIQQSDLETVVAVAMHHIISDGWSMNLLLEEMTTLYEAFHAGRPSPLPELTTQYADFAYWQRNRREEMDQHLSYWRSRLERSPVIKLPTDRAPAAANGYWGERESFTLSPETTAAIKALSRSQEATLFMTLLAGCNVLLGYVTRLEDIVVGTNIAGRSRKELEPIIGFFADQIVLRTDLTGDPSFLEILRRVRTQTLEAYLHQDLPFDRLVAALQPDRGEHSTPLFQVKFDLLYEPPTPQSLKSLELTPIGVERIAARYDLHILMADSSAGLAGSLVYRPDRISRSTIHRLSQLYQRVLQIAATEPGVGLGALNTMLAEVDRQEQRKSVDQLNQAGLNRLRGLKPRKTVEQVLVKG